MRKATLISLSVVLMAVMPAWGTVLVEETFTHADGALVGQLPEVGAAWAAHSGAGVTPVLVSNNQISLNQGSGTREDVNVGANATMGAGDKWYTAFDLTVPATASAITTTYFAHFLQNSTTFVGRVFIAAPAGATGSGYNLGLSNASSTMSVTSANGDLAFDTTYRVVTAYDYSTGLSTLWINPATEASASVSAADTGYSDPVVGYAFRQASGNTTQVIDNLMVGTTFGSVVPEPATLTLLAAAGALVWRRRR